MKKADQKAPCFEPRVSDDGSTVSIAAPAKINLFLKVIGRRDDGYHDIYSWFQTLDLVDRLDIHRTERSEITISTNAENIPTGPENLVYRAARLIQDIGKSRVGFDIRLDKQIPVGAGLGGGSSDAAAFIKAANRLLGLGLSRSDMETIGLEIGSDVPFFFGRGQAEVTGRGEHVRDIQIATDYQVVLVTPDFEINASEAYRRLRLDLTDSIPNINFKCYQQVAELFGVVSGLENDLEKALIGSYPILDKIRRKLTETGAGIVRLSGSGPTMFALYDRMVFSDNIYSESFEGEGWGLKSASPVLLPAEGE